MIENHRKKNKKRQTHWLKILKLHLINTSNKILNSKHLLQKEVDETKPVTKKSYSWPRMRGCVELYVCEYTYKQLNISNWLQKNALHKKNYC